MEKKKAKHKAHQLLKSSVPFLLPQRVPGYLLEVPLPKSMQTQGQDSQDSASFGAHSTRNQLRMRCLVQGLL